MGVVDKFKQDKEGFLKELIRNNKDAFNSKGMRAITPVFYDFSEWDESKYSVDLEMEPEGEDGLLKMVVNVGESETLVSINLGFLVNEDLEIIQTKEGYLTSGGVRNIEINTGYEKEGQVSMYLESRTNASMVYLRILNAINEQLNQLDEFKGIDILKGNFRGKIRLGINQGDYTINGEIVGEGNVVFKISQRDTVTETRLSMYTVIEEGIKREDDKNINGKTVRGFNSEPIEVRVTREVTSEDIDGYKRIINSVYDRMNKVVNSGPQSEADKISEKVKRINNSEEGVKKLQRFEVSLKFAGIEYKKEDSSKFGKVLIARLPIGDFLMSYGLVYDLRNKEVVIDRAGFINIRNIKTLGKYFNEKMTHTYQGTKNPEVLGISYYVVKAYSRAINFKAQVTPDKLKEIKKEADMLTTDLLERQTKNTLRNARNVMNQRRR